MGLHRGLVGTVQLQTPPPFTVGSKLHHEYSTNGITIPCHAKSPCTQAAPDPTKEGEETGQVHTAAFGILWSEESFLQEALKRGHPANNFDGLSRPSDPP